MFTFYFFIFLLQKIATFPTYDLARKAEVIAQNHSTMSSFEKSYLSKQQSRKKPVVQFSTSSSGSESECQDSKNIKKLSKLDEGILDVEKDYKYNENRNNDNGWSVDSYEKIDCRSDISSNDENYEPIAENLNGSNNESSIEDFSSNNDDYESLDGDVREEDLNCSRDENKNYSLEESCFDENGSKNLSQTDLCNTRHSSYESTNLEQQDMTSGYNDFSDERRLPHIEKAVFNALQQLKENKSLLTECNDSVNEMKIEIKNLSRTVKDLAVEVFGSKEELKKRNGLFTDMLVPEIRLPIKGVTRYGDVEIALHKDKIVDNMVSV